MVCVKEIQSTDGTVNILFPRTDAACRIQEGVDQEEDEKFHIDVSAFIEGVIIEAVKEHLEEEFKDAEEKKERENDQTETTVVGKAIQIQNVDDSETKIQTEKKDRKMARKEDKMKRKEEKQKTEEAKRKLKEDKKRQKLDQKENKREEIRVKKEERKMIKEEEKRKNQNEKLQRKEEKIKLKEETKRQKVKAKEDKKAEKANKKLAKSERERIRKVLAENGFDLVDEEDESKMGQFSFVKLLTSCFSLRNKKN